MSQNEKELKGTGRNMLVHLPLIITIVTTFTGFMISYRSQLSLQKENAALMRVNSQLELYYGPLYSFSVLSERTWEDFKRINPEITREKPENVTPEEFYSDSLKEAWKDYMLIVQKPYFIRVETALLDHSDLMEAEKYTKTGDYKYPEPFVNLLSHIYEYNVLFKKWERGDNRKIWGPDYPTDFDTCIRTGYTRLKKKQIELLKR